MSRIFEVYFLTSEFLVEEMKCFFVTNPLRVLVLSINLDRREANVLSEKRVNHVDQLTAVGNDAIHKSDPFI